MPILNMKMVTRIFDLDETKRDDFFEGSALKWSKRASVVYVSVAISSLVAYAIVGSERVQALPPGLRIACVLVGFFVSAGPPAWLWMEARAFDIWIWKKFPEDPAKQIRYRETYKINCDFGKAFWASIIAVYAAVLLRW
jgi:hypothetical protein